LKLAASGRRYLNNYWTFRVWDPDLPRLYQTSREEDRAKQAYRLAYVSPYVQHDLER